MSIDLIAWDIGGAHLKAVGLASSRIERVSQKPTPLWLGLDCFHEAVKAILAEMKAKPDCKHVITMTGELADIFSNRQDGVFQLMRAFEQHAPISLVFAGRQGLLKKVGAEHVADIASANWLATGFYAASCVSNALLIDIGSTTTDLMPIHEGQLAVRAYDDHRRMRSGELIYTGICRTSLMALTQTAPFDGEWLGLMAEHFATTADVYRLCGELPDDADLMPAADGGDKTIDASARRIARLLGLDLESAKFEAWIYLAHYFREQQLIQLRNACERQLSRVLLDEHAPFIGAGAGRFLVKELASRFQRPYIDFIDLFPNQASNPGISDCAPAASLALLARRHAA